MQKETFMKKSMLFSALIFSVAVAMPALAQENVAARIDGKPITRAEVMREVEFMGPQAKQMPMEMVYPQVLQKMVITRMISAKGYAAGIDKDAEVKDRLASAEEQIVADVYLRKTIEPKITEDKIKKRYDELATKFKPVDEVRARHILVATEAEATALIKQITEGGDFGKLAMEKSKDTGSMKQGGDLGYFTKDVMVKNFADAAFAMKAGDISQKPVKTEFGYHVIKVEDKRKSSPPPMAEVKEQIKAQLGQEMVGDHIKAMEKATKIERFNLDGTPMTAPKEQ
jgi:peptidyl-prolyl cis-trans isomerase C